MAITNMFKTNFMQKDTCNQLASNWSYQHQRAKGACLPDQRKEWLKDLMNDEILYSRGQKKSKSWWCRFETKNNKR